MSTGESHQMSSTLSYFIFVPPLPPGRLVSCILEAVPQSLSCSVPCSVWQTSLISQMCHAAASSMWCLRSCTGPEAVALVCFRAQHHYPFLPSPASTIVRCWRNLTMYVLRVFWRWTCVYCNKLVLTTYKTYSAAWRGKSSGTLH